MNELEYITITCGPDKIKGTDSYIDDNDFIVKLPPLLTLKQIVVNCKGED